MHYQLLRIPGCDRQNIPNASSLNDLVTSYGVGVVADLPRVATGREITVNMSFEVGSDPPTHIVEYLSSTQFCTVYRITVDVKMAAILDEQEEHVFKGELCGVLTLLVNPSRIQRQLWHLTRATVNDYLAGRTATAEEIDALYPMSTSGVGRVRYTFPTDYQLAVTFYKTPGQYTLQSGDRDYVAPFTCLLRGYAGKPAYAAFVEWIGTLSDADLKNIYRVQMVPTALASTAHAIGLFMISYEVSGTVKSLTYAVVDDFAGYLPFGAVTYNEQTSVDCLKSWGEPEYELVVMGDVVARWPAISTLDPTTYTPVTYDVRMSATVSAGVNAYVEVTESLTVGAVAKVSVPLPEVQAVGNGLTSWWEGAKEQVLTQAGIGVASALVSAVATQGTAAVPALIGLGAQAAGVINQAIQASHRVVYVGSGAACLYVTDPSGADYLRLRLSSYSSLVMAMRDRWLKLHGYRVTLDVSSLSGQVPLRRSYYYCEGNADVSLRPGTLQSTCISSDELSAAINDELADGIRIWHVAIADPASANNENVSPI